MVFIKINSKLMLMLFVKPEREDDPVQRKNRQTTARSGSRSNYKRYKTLVVVVVVQNNSEDLVIVCVPQ